MYWVLEPNFHCITQLQFMIYWVKRVYRHIWNHDYLGLSERELTIFHFYQSLSLYLNEFNHWVERCISLKVYLLNEHLTILLSADLNSYAEKGKILPVGHVYWTFFSVGNTGSPPSRLYILGLYQWEILAYPKVIISTKWEILGLS